MDIYVIWAAVFTIVWFLNVRNKTIKELEEK